VREAQREREREREEEAEESTRGWKKSFAVGLPRSLTHHEGLDFRGCPCSRGANGRATTLTCATAKKQPSSNLRASEGLVPRRAHRRCAAR